MNSTYFIHRALGVGAVAALLVGCGGPQSPASGALSMHFVNIGEARQHGHSWMLPEAKSEDLLYAVEGCGGTCVLSYPKGNLVGTLDEPQSNAQAACSDRHGNVFLSDNTSVLEYVHGGTSPIATLQLPGNSASGCSLDPKTGDLAVVFRGSHVDVAIFPGARGSPSLYLSQIESIHCGFDGSGDLFVDGFNSSLTPALSELPARGNSFSTLSIRGDVGDPGQVQWDGTYITYESTTKHDPKISQLRIAGSAATVVGATPLKKINNGAAASWIYQSKVIVPYLDEPPLFKHLAVWKYPAGGNPVKVFNDFGEYRDTLDFHAVTLSVASKP